MAESESDSEGHLMSFANNSTKQNTMEPTSALQLNSLSHLLKPSVISPKLELNETNTVYTMRRDDLLPQEVVDQLNKMKKNQLNVVKNQKIQPIETGIKVQKLSYVVDLPENANHIERLMMNLQTGYSPNEQFKPKPEDLRLQSFMLNNQSARGDSIANGGCTKGIHPKEMNYQIDKDLPTNGQKAMIIISDSIIQQKKEQSRNQNLTLEQQGTAEIITDQPNSPRFGETVSVTQKNLNRQDFQTSPLSFIRQSPRDLLKRSRFEKHSSVSPRMDFEEVDTIQHRKKLKQDIKMMDPMDNQNNKQQFMGQVSFNQGNQQIMRLYEKQKKAYHNQKNGEVMTGQKRHEEFDQTFDEDILSLHHHTSMFKKNGKGIDKSEVNVHQTDDSSEFPSPRRNNDLPVQPFQSNKISETASNESQKKMKKTTILKKRVDAKNQGNENDTSRQSKSLLDVLSQHATSRQSRSQSKNRNNMKNSDIHELEDQLNNSRSNSREKVKITENVSVSNQAPRNKTASDNKRNTTTPKTAKKAMSSERRSGSFRDFNKIINKVEEKDDKDGPRKKVFSRISQRDENIPIDLEQAANINERINQLKITHIEETSRNNQVRQKSKPSQKTDFESDETDIMMANKKFSKETIENNQLKMLQDKLNQNNIFGDFIHKKKESVEDQAPSFENFITDGNIKDAEVLSKSDTMTVAEDIEPRYNIEQINAPISKEQQKQEQARLEKFRRFEKINIKSKILCGDSPSPIGMKQEGYQGYRLEVENLKFFGENLPSHTKEFKEQLYRKMMTLQQRQQISRSKVKSPNSQDPSRTSPSLAKGSNVVAQRQSRMGRKNTDIHRELRDNSPCTELVGRDSPSGNSKISSLPPATARTGRTNKSDRRPSYMSNDINLNKPHTSQGGQPMHLNEMVLKQALTSGGASSNEYDFSNPKQFQPRVGTSGIDHLPFDNPTSSSNPASMNIEHRRNTTMNASQFKETLYMGTGSPIMVHQDVGQLDIKQAQESDENFYHNEMQPAIHKIKKSNDVIVGQEVIMQSENANNMSSNPREDEQSLKTRSSVFSSKNQIVKNKNIQGAKTVRAIFSSNGSTKRGSAQINADDLVKEKDNVGIQAQESFGQVNGLVPPPKLFKNQHIKKASMNNVRKNLPTILPELNERRTVVQRGGLTIETSGDTREAEQKINDPLDGIVKKDNGIQEDFHEVIEEEELYYLQIPSKENQANKQSQLSNRRSVLSRSKIRSPGANSISGQSPKLHQANISRVEPFMKFKNDVTNSSMWMNKNVKRKSPTATQSISQHNTGGSMHQGLKELEFRTNQTISQHGEQTRRFMNLMSMKGEAMTIKDVQSLKNKDLSAAVTPPPLRTAEDQLATSSIKMSPKIDEIIKPIPQKNKQKKELTKQPKQVENNQKMALLTQKYYDSLNVFNNVPVTSDFMAVSLIPKTVREKRKSTQVNNLKIPELDPLIMKSLRLNTEEQSSTERLKIGRLEDTRSLFDKRRMTEVNKNHRVIKNQNRLETLENKKISQYRKVSAMYKGAQEFQQRQQKYFQEMAKQYQQEIQQTQPQKKDQQQDPLALSDDEEERDTYELTNQHIPSSAAAKYHYAIIDKTQKKDENFENSATTINLNAMGSRRQSLMYNQSGVRAFESQIGKPTLQEQRVPTVSFRKLQPNPISKKANLTFQGGSMLSNVSNSNNLLSLDREIVLQSIARQNDETYTVQGSKGSYNTKNASAAEIFLVNSSSGIDNETIQQFVNKRFRNSPPLDFLDRDLLNVPLIPVVIPQPLNHTHSLIVPQGPGQLKVNPDQKLIQIQIKPQVDSSMADNTSPNRSYKRSASPSPVSPVQQEKSQHSNSVMAHTNAKNGTTERRKILRSESD